MDASPTMTPDQRAAHALLSELRTRIATQRLPHQHGVEARALESLWEIFGLARQAMKDNPGCADFARAAATMLNVHLRPVTAKWHRAHRDGVLDSMDGANRFRADLEKVRRTLLTFSMTLQRIAYGAAEEDGETPPAIGVEEIEGCFRPVRFGIRAMDGVDARTVRAIDEAEAGEVVRRRLTYGIDIEGGGDERHDAVGLALSGGGIRSATFCLGVVQVLAERGLMRDVDFLSTVSGGGYVGALLTSAVGGGGDYADFSASRGPDTERVRYVRRHARYLSARDVGQRWLMATGTLAGLLLNWTAPLSVIAALSLLRVTVGASLDGAAWDGLAALSGAVTAITLLIYGVALRRGAAARIGARVLAWGAGSTAAALVMSLVEHGYELSPAADGQAALVLLSVLAFPALVRFLPAETAPATRRLALGASLWAAGTVVPLLAIASYYALRRVGIDVTHGKAILTAVAGVSGAFALLALDVNLTGPQKLYRDALARTFVRSGPGADDPQLSSVNGRATAPYHLINATLNLPSSTSPLLKDRRGDFFLFSKHWCGAPSIGYHRTGDWKVDGAPVDLSTAMAVSGAAVSPHMGFASVPGLSALLTLMDLRLGLWLRRPGTAPRRCPGFACLVREMTGWAMSESDAWLNVTDGGHIENMGLYELLRRRCKFIICVDGEADPAATFAGQLTLVRHARIDLGVLIEPRLDEIRPDAASRLSRSHAQLFKVAYRDADGSSEVGLLLYLKLSLTGDEAEALKRYRTLHPDFPHQPTLDQFYDEEQFEAYRQLGAHVAEGMFAPALLVDDPAPPSIARWFRQLAANMLEPGT